MPDERAKALTPGQVREAYVRFLADLIREIGRRDDPVALSDRFVRSPPDFDLEDGTRLGVRPS